MPNWTARTKDCPRSFDIQIPWEMNTISYMCIVKIKLVPTDLDVKLVDKDDNPIGEVI